MNPAENFAIMSSVGLIGKTMEAPFERIKLLLQSQREIINAGRMADPYKGIRDCIVRTYRTEGFLSFWRGNLIACIGFVPQNAMKFVLQQKFKAIAHTSARDSKGRILATSMFSGIAASFTTMALLYPLEYCRSRLANDVIFNDKGASRRQFKGIIDVFRKTWASDGIVGMYRGFLVSCVGIIVYRGFYFGFYDALKSIFLDDKSPMTSSVAVGVIATFSAGLVAYPFDTIRVRMLMRSIEPVKYKSFIDCGSQILKKEGVRPLMNGFVVTIFRGVIGGIAIPILDKVLNKVLGEVGDKVRMHRNSEDK
ncbi:hypothetical protein FSP39_015435 [Pinctada imbricata]|uniref:ADP/ATP translocase n=1 Tax=Pinctada imbricata TaxID=66713 RepID=A0AA89BZG7_PINIB|nr:hypothetical protein FSP39_015435 [Pinctada imbricata]